MDRLTTIKAAACTAAAALTAFWGWTGWLAAAWFLAMLLDYATGSAAALRAGTWSSRAAREGLWHKAGSVAGVLVAALLDFALRVLLGSVPGLGKIARDEIDRRAAKVHIPGLLVSGALQVRSTNGKTYSEAEVQTLASVVARTKGAGIVKDKIAELGKARIAELDPNQLNLLGAFLEGQK